MSKVFGIGWAKTGTSTLGRCFEILAFNHQSQNLQLVKDIAKNDISRILKLAEKKDTFEDWPWIILYKELDIAFPNSRFILTKRDSGKWIQSYRNMLAEQGEVSEELNEIRRILYGLPFPHVLDEQLVARYEKHNSEVAYYFRNRSDQLLLVDWERGDGWKELCEFLGKDIPNKRFPHVNKSEHTGKAIIHGMKGIIKKFLR